MTSHRSPSSLARWVAKRRSSGELVPIGNQPAHSRVVQVLGVSYLHLPSDDDGDLYLTTAGAQYLPQLRPQYWYEEGWFREQRVRLGGTAAVYRVPTDPRAGEQLDLVVKFSRVGQEVAAGGDDFEEALSWEFNGPFEEFGLVQELRHAATPGAGVRTQVPLAIYLPPERLQPSRSGRSEWRMARKIAQHPGVALDILRYYVMVYRWVPGIDAWQARREGLLSQQEASDLTERAAADLEAVGYRVLDNKPQHLIVDPAKLDGSQRNEAIAYELVDFELLERTHERELGLERRCREAYERQQRILLGDDDGAPSAPLPAHLQTSTILGAPYLVGATESTSGKLWVVGHEPDAFDLFLPERWRTTPQIRLWENHESFLTTTKDNLALVWKVSRVGERPETAAFGSKGFRVLAHGFNSPFEEVAMALWLLRNNVGAILPRAIYRTGHRTQLDDARFDPSRYRSHQEMGSDEPLLERRRNYITIWDACCGPHLGAPGAKALLRSLNCDEARRLGLLSARGMQDVLDRAQARLLAVQLEPLRFLPSHVLVLQDSAAGLLREDGEVAARICNFLYLRWLGSMPLGSAEPRQGAQGRSASPASASVCT